METTCILQGDMLYFTSCLILKYKIAVRIWLLSAGELQMNISLIK